MRAVSLHPDVLLVTSALLRVNCVVVRGGVSGVGASGSGASEERRPGAYELPLTRSLGAEAFVIDSPVLPDELDALPSLLQQAGFPQPSGLLATHGDWDHLLGRIAFPGLALGCAESTARRLMQEPGGAQRELRDFDEELGIDRPGPLSLGSVQGLPVPGRCEIGDRELELHTAQGHTVDGMAIAIPWAGVLVAGDYLSSVEIPQLNAGDLVDEYLETLDRLGNLVRRFEHVVPGHGPAIDGARARDVCEQDAVYLRALRARGSEAELPEGRRSRGQRAIHEHNVAQLTSS